MYFRLLGFPHPTLSTPGKGAKMRRMVALLTFHDAAT
jgi:hypothetical protein